MKKYLLTIFTLISPLFSLAQEAQEMGIDEKIDQAFGEATGWFVNFNFYQIYNNKTSLLTFYVKNFNA